MEQEACCLSSAETPNATSEPDDTLTLTIHYHSQPIELTFTTSATITDLSTLVSTDLDIPPSNQKFLVSPKPGLLRPPFKDPLLPLSSIAAATKVTLYGSTITEVASITAAISSIRARQTARSAALRAGRAATAHSTPRHDWRTAQANATYTFHSIKPLPYLRDPAKSQRFLERLATDAGIRAAMRAHRFSVGLLTEMDPAAHTTHESRTLGLNRNRGEVVELRLRTDAGDGYRDYRVIRNTLCHELAHNVWGEHDARFWKLCKEIEKEVEKGDWTRGGKSVGGEEFYNPDDMGVGDDHEADEGGWTGGEYVLGAAAVGSGTAGGGAQPMNRREIMAQAAEERVKRQKAVEKSAERDDGGSSPAGS